MILAIDPGGTTGIAYLAHDGQFGTGQLANGFDGFADWMTEQYWEAFDAIVIENFIPRPGAKSQQLDALHIIGAVKFMCRKHGVPLIIQSPANAKSFSTNDKLTAAGWYTVGEDHGRDAARHLLVFLIQHGMHVSVGRYWEIREKILKALVAL